MKFLGLLANDFKHTCGPVSFLSNQVRGISLWGISLLHEIRINFELSRLTELNSVGAFKFNVSATSESNFQSISSDTLENNVVTAYRAHRQNPS